MDVPSARALPGAAAGGPGPALAFDLQDGPDGGMPLRAALALSLATGRPFHMQGIRRARAQPGLQRAHVAALAAAAAVSGGHATGAEAGATDVAFTPGELVHGEHTFGAGSAGSCLLLLQAIWPALAVRDGESRLVLRGTTHGTHAPPFQFVQRAYAPLLARLGASSSLRLRRHGFQPTGGGGVEVTLSGTSAPVPFDLVERGALQDSHAECLVAAVPRHVAARELDTLGHALGWTGDQLRVPLVRQNEGPGNALMATLVHGDVTEVMTAIGEKGISAETVARQVARDVRTYLASGAALGPWLAEQWLLPLALAVWRSGTPARFTCSAATPLLRRQAQLVAAFLSVQVDIGPVGPAWLVRVAR